MDPDDVKREIYEPGYEDYDFDEEDSYEEVDESEDYFDWNDNY
jgi:hypothetical protein